MAIGQPQLTWAREEDVQDASEANIALIWSSSKSTGGEEEGPNSYSAFS
jgi:hypothetical protein